MILSCILFLYLKRYSPLFYNILVKLLEISFSFNNLSSTLKKWKKKWVNVLIISLLPLKQRNPHKTLEGILENWDFKLHFVENNFWESSLGTKSIQSNKKLKNRGLSCWVDSRVVTYFTLIVKYGIKLTETK